MAELPLTGNGLAHPNRIAAMLCGLLSLVLYGGELLAQSAAGNDVPTKVERGLTGSYRFSYLGKPLQAKSQRDSDAPLGIRLAASSEDRQRYEVKFLGNKEGTYDLRLLMEHVDGSEVTDLAPIPVEIVSMLPKDQRSDLFESANFEPTVWGGYRLSLGLIGLIWLGVPIAYFIRKSLLAKPIIELAIVEPPPTFADQLRPLVEAAASRTLSVREKGRLELLLVHYWRERIAIQSIDMASAIRQLRSHPEAGPLVTTVERWLHQSEASVDDSERSPDSIVELLKPYRGAVPLDETPTLVGETGSTSP